MTDLLGPASSPNSLTVRPAESRSFGMLDTFFKDCTPGNPSSGTQLVASFLNETIAQLRSTIRSNGATGGGIAIVSEDNTDDALVLKSIQHLIQRGQTNYSEDTGIANAVVIAPTPAAAEYKKGMRFWVKVAVDNTAASTLAVSSMAAVAIKTVAGQPLQKGMLVAGQVAEFVYDGTNFQMISVVSEKFIFTPRATIYTSDISSLPYSTFTSHTCALQSSTNLTPVINSGGSTFSLPAGTYLFICRTSTRLNNVINNTQAAHQLRLAKNGGQLNSDFETTYLTAGQDITTYRNLAIVASAVPTDTFALQSFAGTTQMADFNGANAGNVTADIVRIGN